MQSVSSTTNNRRARSCTKRRSLYSCIRGESILRRPGQSGRRSFLFWNELYEFSLPLLDMREKSPLQTCLSSPCLASSTGCLGAERLHFVCTMRPYFFLARDALQRKNYHDAWGLSLHAIELGERLGRPSEDEVPSGALAQLYEWLAISMAELGQPKDRVLDNFRKAQSLDPNNQRIQKNHAIAEGRWVAPEFKPGDQWKIDGASTKIVLPVEFPEESEAPDLFVKRADAGLLALASHR